MKRAGRAFGMTGTIARSLFGGPATLPYPQQPRAYPEATRGRVGVDIATCIFCRLCEKNCPTGAISVDKEQRRWQVDSLRCCVCRRCVEVCPKKCALMENTPFPAVTERPAGIFAVTKPAGEPAAPPEDRERGRSGT